MLLHCLSFVTCPSPPLHVPSHVLSLSSKGPISSSHVPFGEATTLTPPIHFLSLTFFSNYLTILPLIPIPNYHSLVPLFVYSVAGFVSILIHLYIDIYITTWYHHIHTLRNNKTKQNSCQLYLSTLN